MIDNFINFVTEYHVLRWGVIAFVALIIIGSLVKVMFPNSKIFKR